MSSSMIPRALAAAAAAALLMSATAVAADPRDEGQPSGQHAGAADNGPAIRGQDHSGDRQWRRGQRIGHDDWSSAQPVDYRQHHLRHPPRGYEWRESHGQYVLAAVATGVI